MREDESRSSVREPRREAGNRGWKSDPKSEIKRASDMTLIHGGNVYEIASKLGCAPEDVLDYSASINPLGPPPGLVDLFNDTFQRLQHYPDIQNRVLVDSIARHHGVSPDQVVVGNGSTELIYWLPKVLGIRKALIVLPTFAEYQKAFELQGVQLAKLITSPESDFQPDGGTVGGTLRESFHRKRSFSPIPEARPGRSCLPTCAPGWSRRAEAGRSFALLTRSLSISVKRSR